MPSGAWWGVNHLKFLPWPYILVYGLLAGTIAVLVLLPHTTSRWLDTLFSNAATAMFEYPSRTALVIAAIFGVLFAAFRIKTYFLGDGYTLLSSYGIGTTYYLKWTEMGAILLLRALQAVLGGYTPQTALIAAQAISVGSGIIVVLNLIWIARHLGGTPRAFAVCLAALLFSGAMLLFFGYVEFYPPLWAAATTFLNAALYYLLCRRHVLLVLLAYAMTVGVHLQALCWAPAVAFLVHDHLEYHQVRSIWRFIFGATMLLALALSLAGIVWLVHHRLDIKLVFLPLFVGRPASPEYAALSPKHLVDIVNLVFVIVPGVLVLLALVRLRQAAANSPLRYFLILASLGSLSFLFLVDPVIGLGRDWDLMSLTLLAPLLVLLLAARPEMESLPTRHALGFALLCLLTSLLFFGTDQNVHASEKRFWSILDHYGSKNRAGWIILRDYYVSKNDRAQVSEVDAKMARLFPDEHKIKEAYALITSRDYDKAHQIAQELYAKDPYRPDYMQLLGNTLGKQKKYDQAVRLYRDALQLRPNFAQQRNELGLLYLEMKQYDSAIVELGKVWKQNKSITGAAEGIALAYIHKQQLDSAESYARQLFQQDSTSAGAHLIEMTIALNRGDTPSARRHYEEYLAHGAARSDYENIKGYYGRYFR